MSKINKVKLRINIYIIIVLLIPTIANAQVTVSGSIKDNDGEGVIGVTIIEKGTANGTVTDVDGNYKLEVADENSVLVFSHIGFIKQEITVGSRTILDVILEIDIASLEEVVVVGYGSQRKSDITGAVSIVDVDALDASVFTSVTDRLQGRVAGVQVNTGGAPGTIGTIRIRGSGFQGNNDPLFVIDGVLTDDSPNLNPNDIESIQVLKDASSAAIYGVRAANGVVVITTKKGNSGKPTISFSTKVGLQDIPNQLEMMNAAQYARISNQAHDNDGLTRMNLANDLSHGVDTDWQDEVTQYGLLQDFNLSISTGGEKSKTYFSLNNVYQDGVVKGPIFERLSTRLNTEFELMPGLVVGENLTVGRSTRSGEQAEGGGSAGTGGEVFAAATGMLPIIPVYDPFELSGYGVGDLDGDALTFTPNPVGVIDLFKNKTNELQVLGNLFLKYEIIKGLEYQLSFGFDYTSTFSKSWGKQGVIGIGRHPSNLNETRSTSQDTFWENRLSYTKTIGKHNFSVMGTYVEQEQNSDFTAVNITEGFNIEDPLFEIDASNATPNNVTATGGRVTTTYASLLGRATYNFDDRYFLTANIRRDASSKFSSDERVDVFPSASFGWNLTNESFFDVQFVNDLKFRAGYGEVGSMSAGDYAFQSQLAFANYNLGPNSTNANGITRGAIVDRNIKWEVLKELNLGLDMVLLEGKLEFIGDFYMGNLEDVLFDVQLPQTIGQGGSGIIGESAEPVTVLTNAVSSERYGWETSVTYRKEEGDFQFAISANLFNSYVQVKSLPFGVTEFISNSGVSRVGSLYGEFFVLEDLGVYTSEQDIIDHGVTSIYGFTPSVGDAKYRDVNGRDDEGNLTGEPDGQITPDDRVIMGDPYPDLNYGLNFQASYKDFDFVIFFQGVLNRELYNQQYVDLNLTTQNNYTVDYDPYIEGIGSEPRPRVVDSGNNIPLSSRYIEDASYLRLKNLELGYNFKLKNLANMRTFIGGQNLFLVTKFKGQDPEFEGTDSVFEPGFYAGGFPNIRTYYAGFNIIF